MPNPVTIPPLMLQSLTFRVIVTGTVTGAQKCSRWLAGHNGCHRCEEPHDSHSFAYVGWHSG
jgi:hypothetical protein